MRDFIVLIHVKVDFALALTLMLTFALLSKVLGDGVDGAIVFIVLLFRVVAAVVLEGDTTVVVVVGVDIDGIGANVSACSTVSQTASRVDRVRGRVCVLVVKLDTAMSRAALPALGLRRNEVIENKFVQPFNFICETQNLKSERFDRFPWVSARWEVVMMPVSRVLLLLLYSSIFALFAVQACSSAVLLLHHSTKLVELSIETIDHFDLTATVLLWCAWYFSCLPRWRCGSRLCFGSFRCFVGLLPLLRLYPFRTRSLQFLQDELHKLLIVRRLSRANILQGALHLAAQSLEVVTLLLLCLLQVENPLPARSSSV